MLIEKEERPEASRRQAAKLWWNSASGWQSLSEWRLIACFAKLPGSRAWHTKFFAARLLAFLNDAPLRPGHVQIVPVAHVEEFDDLSPALAAVIIHVGQRIAKEQKKHFGIERVAFPFTGGDIRPVHAHVISMEEKTDITSRRHIEESEPTYRPLLAADPDDLRRMAEVLRILLAD